MVIRSWRCHQSDLSWMQPTSGSHVSAGANGAMGARLFKLGAALVGLRLTVPWDDMASIAKSAKLYSSVQQPRAVDLRILAVEWQGAGKGQDLVSSPSDNKIQWLGLTAMDEHGIHG